MAVRESAPITLLAALIALAGPVGCGPGDAGSDDDSGTGDDDIGTSGDDDSATPADDDSGSAGDDDSSEAGDDDTTPAGPCPPEMAHVEDPGFCIDRWEAACELTDGTPWSPYEDVDDVQVRARAEAGAVPQGYISGDQAAAACQAAGKRLCTSEEWLLTCQGPQGLTWPYGATHVPGLCNDDYASHPVVDYFGTSDAWVWTYESMNDPGINQQPGTVSPAGDHPDCVSAFGAYDMVGNLHEWVADPDGTFRGGFYVDVEINGPGCTYATTAHASSYHDYSTGFRCCADPAR